MSKVSMSALALSAGNTFLEPVLNLQILRTIGHVWLVTSWQSLFSLAFIGGLCMVIVWAWLKIGVVDVVKINESKGNQPGRFHVDNTWTICVKLRNKYSLKIKKEKRSGTWAWAERGEKGVPQKSKVHRVTSFESYFSLTAKPDIHYSF